MAEINVEFDPSRFIAKLQAIPTDNAQSGLEAAASYLLSQAQQSIKAGGPGWQNFKRPPKPPHQLLFLTGSLYASLAQGNSNNIWQESPGEIIIGSNLPYAAALNFGDGPRDLPARSYLFSDATRDNQAAMLLRHHLLPQ